MHCFKISFHHIAFVTRNVPAPSADTPCFMLLAAAVFQKHSSDSLLCFAVSINLTFNYEVFRLTYKTAGCYYSAKVLPLLRGI